MDKKLVGLMVVFVLFFGLFTSLVIFQTPIKNFTRAAAESVPSADKSLIFSWPKIIKADGKETSSIDVIVRNGDSSPLPIANRLVSISSDIGKIDSVSKVTDELGRVTFTISSDIQGVANISATVDGSTQLINKVSVKFE